MSVASCVGNLLTHPSDVLTWAQFLLYRARRNITFPHEHPTSGWDRPSMRRCWTLLDQTSHSFSGVIKELDGELARTTCLFYLVFRTISTIKDDMTIPHTLKQTLLRSFHIHAFTPGWTFDRSGPHEKGRQILVDYDAIAEEILMLKPTYRVIFADIVERMATSMADHTTKNVHIATVAEYDLYCHYASGLVGEGLSRIFSASRHEARWLEDQIELSDAMGLLLQKTNIIRDVREDVGAQRYFWPREIWEPYGFSTMEDLCDPASRERTIWPQSAMIADALRHTIDALKYLQLLTNQSIFNFCAMPAVMALANLHMYFMNTDIFDRHLKLRKAEAARLIMRSTSISSVASIFSEYARKIHAKSVPEDPNHLRISIACGKIQQWQERFYPSAPRTHIARNNSLVEVKDTSFGSTHEKAALQKDQTLLLTGSVECVLRLPLT
ncbi:hypothetical protein H0H87_002505 [Tephrocybe sp. NHM501043]|nr:hypothetical protein H0H87_002505 [Tephrocybe sp. NHM501043]